MRPDSGNLQRRNVGGSHRQAIITPQRLRSSDASAGRLTGLAIVDDLPERIPVSRREIDVIETYLGDLLDKALGRPE